MRKPPAIALVSLGLTIAAMVLPIGVQAGPVDPAAVKAKVAEAKARLNLTPEQEAQLEPVVRDRTAKLKAIHAAHAGDQSRAARRAMFKAARPVQDEYDKKVRAILTHEQEQEWEVMRAEARKKLKEQYRKGDLPD